MGYIRESKDWRTSKPNKRFIHNVLRDAVSSNRPKTNDDQRKRDGKTKDRKRRDEKSKSHHRRSDPASLKHPTKQRKVASEEAITKEEGFIGPSCPTASPESFLTKTKVRGRGSVGSNMLNQYFHHEEET
eukprot:TRINITY_DN2603_c0_g1_i1.p1 TRINITY_DN2603_c0_g1~~TRINITY_DN2603_c0_g1_i1.p1  ORF type:complete len:130 (+),score=17.05 TRINITY_DN2603_c0_g1_i1:88-477(+)